MNLEKYLTQVKQGDTIEGGSDAHLFMHEMAQEAMRITAELNGSYHHPEEIRALISALIGKPVDETFAIFPPFYADFGKNISIGKNVFINSGCRFQDHGGISIGDGALIGHAVVMATLNHELEPARRSSMHPAPIVIGTNAWVGANATILPGVTIGDNAVIAAGAVVTKDVEPGTVVGGVPARFIKRIE